MNEEQFDDLKQFIASTVSQSETRLEAKIDRLEATVDDGFAGVGKAIDDLGEDLDKRFDAQQSLVEDHESRITKLEERAA